LIRQFLLALGFLTRLPIGWLACTPKEIGKAARWFPLVGGVLGAIYIGALRLLMPFFPPLIIAVLIIALDALLTGAMHFDGLADTADGFGAGHAREDVLRIMRDHAIGSYGACALFLALALKIAAIGSLIGDARAFPSLLLAPVLGRWSAVFSPAVAGYARPVADDAPRSVGSPARFIGRSELIFATLIAAAFTVAFPHRRSAVAAVLVAAIITGWTLLCRRRIGGVTGDTLGAGIEIAECLVLLAFSVRS
jgi:adenosylcobinamide-GDP ribazoletransferase